MLAALLPLAVLAALVTVGSIVLLRRRSPAPLPAPPAELPAPEPPVREQPGPRAVVVAEAVPAPPALSGEAVRPRAIPSPLLVPPPPRPPLQDAGHALAALDALLEELESATVRIGGADALDEGSVAELEGLADRLEAAAASLATR